MTKSSYFYFKSAKYQFNSKLLSDNGSCSAHKYCARSYCDILIVISPINMLCEMKYILLLYSR